QRGVSRLLQLPHNIDGEFTLEIGTRHTGSVTQSASESQRDAAKPQAIYGSVLRGEQQCGDVFIEGRGDFSRFEAGGARSAFVDDLSVDADDIHSVGPRRVIGGDLVVEPVDEARQRQVEL